MAKKGNKSGTDRLQEQVIREHHRRGNDVEITEYPSGSKDVTSRKDGQKSENSAILKRLRHDLNGNEEPLKKKTYRSNKELPFPELGSQHAANREKKAITLRLVPELIEEVDQAAKAAGLDRTAWITSAIMQKLSDSAPEPDEDITFDND